MPCGGNFSLACNCLRLKDCRHLGLKAEDSEIVCMEQLRAGLKVFSLAMVLSHLPGDWVVCALHDDLYEESEEK
jgi:hypothetical protein